MDFTLTCAYLYSDQSGAQSIFSTQARRSLKIDTTNSLSCLRASVSPPIVQKNPHATQMPEVPTEEHRNASKRPPHAPRGPTAPHHMLTAAPQKLYRAPRGPRAPSAEGSTLAKPILWRIGANPAGLSGRVRAPAAKPTARRRSQWKIHGGGHLSTRKIGPEGGASARILSTALLPPLAPRGTKTRKRERKWTNPAPGACSARREWLTGHSPGPVSAASTTGGVPPPAGGGGHFEALRTGQSDPPKKPDSPF